MDVRYAIKDKMFKATMPVMLPAVGVPLSLAAGMTLHAVANVRRGFHWNHHARPSPTQVPPDAGGEVRTLDEAISRLPLDAYHPLPLDGYDSTTIRGLVDIAPMYFDTGTLLRGRLYRYPRHFHETLIPVLEGTPISGIMGLHHAKLPRPGLVIIHGLMNSKRQDQVRPLTIKAFYDWGFNVCAIDLRGFGRSAESVSVPSAAGGIEAGDVMDVVRYLRRFPHFTSIGLLGFSLGGGTVIKVAAAREAPGLIDGGVMAISPPINFEAALNRFEDPPEDHQHLMTYHYFRFLIQRMLTHAEIMRWARKKLKAEGGDPNIDGFRSYLRNLVAWGYLGHGFDSSSDPDTLLEKLLKLTSPKRDLARVKVPTFVLQALDDPITPISAEEVEELRRLSRESPLLRCHFTERGGHTAFQVLDRAWYYEVIRKYFTYWGDWVTEKRHPFA